MWRRASSHFHFLASWRSTVQHGSPTVGAFALIQRTSLFSTDSGIASRISNKRVEDIMPIATGLEREELQAELEGRNRFDMDPPVGPFGTKIFSLGSPSALEY